jgi:tetratricopeptide (TPR) repeat protein
MSENDQPAHLPGKNASEFAQASRERGNFRAATSDIKESEAADSLLPAVSEGASVSKEILGYVQELQDKNIERLGPKAIGHSAIDRRRFFRQFNLALVGLMLCVVCFKPIAGFRLAAHASMAPILTKGQSIQARLAYADFLESAGKASEAIVLYKALKAQLSLKKNNPQLVALVNLKLAQLLLSSDPASAKNLVDESLGKLGDPNEATPETLVETLRHLAMSYIDRSEALAAYPIAMAASEFWGSGHTMGSGGNLFADLADLLSEQGNWQLAFDCYKEAFSFSEDWGDADFNIYRLNQMAISKVHLNEPQEALELFERATTMDRKVYRGKLYYTLESMPKMGWCLVKLDRPAEAVSVLNAAMPLSGDVRNEALEQLAYAYQLQSKNDEVIRVLNELQKDGATTSSLMDIKKNLAKIKHGGQANK